VQARGSLLAMKPNSAILALERPAHTKLGGLEVADAIVDLAPLLTYRRVQGKEGALLKCLGSVPHCVGLDVREDLNPRSCER
jgi:hypothetical protein